MGFLFFSRISNDLVLLFGHIVGVIAGFDHRFIGFGEIVQPAALQADLPFLRLFLNNGVEQLIFLRSTLLFLQKGQARSEVRNAAMAIANGQDGKFALGLCGNFNHNPFDDEGDPANGCRRELV